MGVDAIAAAAHFVSQVQTIVSREVKPISPAVVTIGELHGGTARNIIAGTAVLKGIVRTMEPGLAEKIEAGDAPHARRASRSACASITRSTGSASRRCCAIDPSTLERMLKSAREVLGAENVYELPEPSMGSEDFAWFAEKVPAAHLRIGSKIDGLDTAIHRANYDCNDLAIPVGVRVLTRAALDLTGS